MKLDNLTGFSIKQLSRTPKKTVLYFALPFLAAAFLCLGLNLYQYASSNLNAVYTAFDVTAVPSFKANIDSYGKLLDFQAALESSGLTAKQETGYTMNVTVYDHNLSQLAPGLESLSQISKLILVLSGLTALLTVVAFAVLYMVQNKRQIAAFRAIGMSKRQVAVLLLFAVLLVCILGAGAGAFVGQKISASVTRSILETAAENRSDPSFSATIADAEEDAEAFTYLEQENPLFPVFTWAGISLALILAMLICFANESKKSPMLLLGTKE